MKVHELVYLLGEVDQEAEVYIKETYFDGVEFNISKVDKDSKGDVDTMNNAITYIKTYGN